MDPRLDSTEIVRSLFGRANDAVLLFHLSPTGEPQDIREANPAAERLYGYPRDELIGLSVTALIGPSVDHRKWLRELAESGSFFVESLHRNKAGEEIPVEVDAQLVELAGRPGVLMMGRDIRERKRVQESARRARARLIEVLESVHDGFIAVDRDWRFIYANQRALAALERPEEELIGAEIWSELPALAGTGFEENCRRAMAEQRSVQFESDSFIPGRQYVFTLHPSRACLGILARDVTEQKGAREEIDRLHRKLEEIVEKIDDGFAALDEDWRFTYLNQKALEYAGKRSEQMEGRRLWDIYPDLEDTRLGAECRRVMEARITQRFEESWPAMGRVFEFTVYPLPEGIAIHAREVTARKREQALIAADQAITRILAGARSVGEAFPAALDVLREALPADLAELWLPDPERPDLLRCAALSPSRDPGSYERFAEESRERTYRAGEGLPGTAWASRASIWVSDFSAPSVFERAASSAAAGLSIAAAFPLLAGEQAWGALAFYSSRALARDETLAGLMASVGSELGSFLQRCRAEEEVRRLNRELEGRVVERTLELSRSERRLRDQTDILQSILESMAEGVMVLDERGERLVLNRAGRALLVERGAEPSVSADWSERHRVFRADGAPCQPAELPLQRALRGEIVDEAEIRLRGPDLPAGERWLSVNARPLRRGGAFRGAVAVFRDITERKAAERRLEEYREKLQALASELTLSEQRERRRLAQLLHDYLQQHLVAAKFSLAALANQLPGGASRSLVRPIDDLLDEAIEISRSVSVELSPPILFEAGLGRGLEWLARHMRSKYGLQVDLDVDVAAEPEAEDVRSLLFQAVRELLFNVLKHAGAGRARVEMRRVGDELEIAVSDEGAGFDPGTLGEAEDSGRAMGLLSIRERLGLLGARMDVASAPGRGTRVAIRALLGAAEAVRPKELPPARRGAPLRPPRAPARKGAIRVLLADDHQIVREGLVQLIEQEKDMEIVGQAADGLEAIELARRVQPDVVVMDVSMPRMNGVEATRRIAAELPRVRVIGLSMHDEENLARQMLDAGAASYVRKGGPSESLLSAIRESRAA